MSALVTGLRAVKDSSNLEWLNRYLGRQGVVGRDYSATAVMTDKDT